MPKNCEEIHEAWDTLSPDLCSYGGTGLPGLAGEPSWGLSPSFPVRQTDQLPRLPALQGSGAGCSLGGSVNRAEWVLTVLQHIPNPRPGDKKVTFPMWERSNLCC